MRPYLLGTRLVWATSLGEALAQVSKIVNGDD